MNIKIIAIGGIKEKYLSDAIAEYQKRLRQFAKTEIFSLQHEKAPQNLSDALMTKIKQTEGKRILDKISDSDFVIALDIKGKSLSSEGLASFIQETVLRSSSIAFVIGGSLGLHEDVLKRANFSLSFSPMTFPHQLMRVMLLEQIYRAFSIINNLPYHK